MSKLVIKSELGSFDKFDRKQEVGCGQCKRIFPFSDIKEYIVEKPDAKDATGMKTAVCPSCRVDALIQNQDDLKKAVEAYNKNAFGGESYETIVIGHRGTYIVIDSNHYCERRKKVLPSAVMLTCYKSEFTSV